MTWQFPLVSRRAFDEAKERILELKTQVADLDKERKRLIDFVSLGITQRSIYGEIPEPKEEVEAEPEPEEKKSEHPTQLEQDVEEYGHSARSIQKATERRNMAKANVDEAEVTRILKEIEADGLKAATNGNHGQ